MRILADTNIWIGHFRLHSGDPILCELLEFDFLACHEIVIGELATGGLPRRLRTIADLRLLPALPSSSFDETLYFLEERSLFGQGLQWNDLQLLSSVVANGETALWTNDKPLHEAAVDAGVAYVPQA